MLYRARSRCESLNTPLESSFDNTASIPVDSDKPVDYLNVMPNFRLSCDSLNFLALFLEIGIRLSSRV